MKKIFITLCFLLCLATFSTPQQVQAEENCFFGICFYSDALTNNTESSTFGSSGGGLTTNTESRADLTTAQKIIAAISSFLNYVIMPFLFAIALLVFLVNATRYFIVEGHSEEGRTKAKRLAIYSIAAFVFLVSIWGIVNMLVGSLGVRNAQAICPDYLPSTWCKQESYSGNFMSFPNSNTNSTSNSDSNSDANNSTATNSTEDPDTPSGIANIVFNQTKDIAKLSFLPGEPRGQFSTPDLNDNQSCQVAMDTLMLAADVEQNQTAYLFYLDANEDYRWTNLTDQHYENGITYDGDVINDLVAAGAHNMYIVHTHQKTYAENASFIGNGMAPSASDMRLMCDSVVRNIKHVLVDWSGVWVMEQPTNSCPRGDQETDLFPTIEAINLLSQIEPGVRNQEFFDLYNSPLVPNQYIRALDAYQNNDFDSMAPSQIRALVAPLLAQASLTLTPMSAESFCSYDNLGLQTNTTSNTSSDNNDVVMCTMDAAVCADGTMIGRSGPDCEFICPDGSTPNSGTVIQ